LIDVMKNTFRDGWHMRYAWPLSRLNIDYLGEAARAAGTAMRSLNGPSNTRRRAMINAAEIIRNKRYREEALKIGTRRVRTRNNTSKAQTKRQSSLNGDFDAPSSRT